MTLAAIRLSPPAAAETIRTLWEAGRAVLPLDPRAPEEEIRGTLDALRPTHLVDAQGTRRLEGGIGVEPDVAAVVTTSGTTGAPRGVELTWEGLRASALAVSDALGTGPTDRWLCCLPIHAVAGLAIVARTWVSGAGLEVAARFDAEGLRTTTATLVSLVPVTLRRALDAGIDVSRFRRVLVGGAPIPEDLRQRAAMLEVPLVVTYGLTETWGGVVHDGEPLPGVRLRLGRANEIEVHGPMVMRGYRLEPEETAGVLDSNGWLRTGDAGTFDADGRLHVVDRLGDIIITGGVNVSPTEVESVLAVHPGLADVCVVGVPDAEWGERVVAYVVPAPRSEAPDLAGLRQFAAAKLAAAKLPRQIVVVNEIPRTAGGKPRRRSLSS
ncbi:MAG: AMP-binding protein [Actinomycetota bacterium]|nr:AMP-binding protein [Actinomycetota bacterium]